MRPVGRLSRRRTLWSLTGAAFVLLALMGRLIDIQVARAQSLQGISREYHNHTIILPASRGMIVDRFGTPLAMDVPRYQVVAVPKYIPKGQMASDAAQLATVLPFPAGRIRQALAGGGWYALLASSVGQSVADRVNALKLTGISVIPIISRWYPDGTLASQVLGMVGTDGQGLSGIEYADNKILAGKNGSWTVQTDAQGNPLPQWQQAYRAPVAGNTVELTLDANIEAVAQKWLKWGVRRAHALNGTVIVLNPKTGAILALANWPNFNPNNYYTATSLQMTDYAVQDPVPPGSIFKPVVAAAALSTGLFTPDSLFDTRGYKIVNGVRIDDWNPSGWGWITLTRGLEVSSDQVFMDLALKMGASTLYRFIQDFGFMHPSGVGLPGDSGGLWLPEAAVNAVDLATIGFGQGFAATPMQVIAADSALANHGTMMQPHIVKAILSPDGSVVQTTASRVESRPVSPQVAAEVERMMTLEATQGTGVPAQVPGYIIAGKTGTAQKIVNGRTSNHLFVSSFIGMGPMPHPRFMMLVMINRPVGRLFYGDQVAAPVWQKIASFMFHYWGIKPYASANNGSASGPVAH